MAAAAAVAPPTHVVHHDASRAGVSTTALGVCAARAWESSKPEEQRLFHDPFAAIICGSLVTFVVEWGHDVPFLGGVFEAQTRHPTGEAFIFP